jgi:hypothetical protein
MNRICAVASVLGATLPAVRRSRARLHTAKRSVDIVQSVRREAARMRDQGGPAVERDVPLEPAGEAGSIAT